MAISRKAALRRLNGLVPQLETHLEKLDAEPNCEAVDHWKAEIESFLSGMEDMLPHVGQQTAKIWAERIAEWRERFDEFCAD